MAGTKPILEDPEVAEVVALAQAAWDRGDPDEAGRILSEFVRRHPEKEAALRGKGFVGLGAASDDPPPPPPSVECLRCGADAPRHGLLHLHGGGNLASFILGNVGELRVDIKRFDVYGCRECGHIEFFTPGKLGPFVEKGARSSEE